MVFGPSRHFQRRDLKLSATDIDITLYDAPPAGFDPFAEIATEVLATELGDSYSDADVIRHAGAWEAVNNRPLKLPLHLESWAQFAKRQLAFSKIKKRPYIADAATMREDLARLLKQPQPINDEARDALNARVHELQDALGINRMDYVPPPPHPDDVQAETLKRFTAIAEIVVWSDRVKAVRKETDLGALNLLSMRDLREEVRSAAMARLLELRG
jgi:hypothetical protein